MSTTWDSEFDQILESTQGRLRDLIAGMGVRPHQVDDLAQETYLAFYEGGSSRPSTVEPMAWLVGIARNLVREHFRKNGRRCHSIEQLLDDPIAPSCVEEEVDESLRVAALHRCLEGLNSEHRDMLMRYYGGVEDGTALASAVGRSPNAIRKLMLRLREDLRACMLLRLKVSERS